MLKGVHHRIVEIRQTENPFFERALLFVRTDCDEQSEEQWQEAGKQFVKCATPFTQLRRQRLFHRLRIAAYLLSGGIGGVVLSEILSKIG